MLAKQYKEEISGLFNSPKVFLYGSYSKGCAHDGSDIDIAVVVPLQDGDWLTATTKLWTASRKLNTLIEPVSCFPFDLADIADSDDLRGGGFLHRRIVRCILHLPFQFLYPFFRGRHEAGKLRRVLQLACLKFQQVFFKLVFNIPAVRIGSIC
jgi:predicted nucleotidyltransferase